MTRTHGSHAGASRTCRPVRAEQLPLRAANGTGARQLAAAPRELKGWSAGGRNLKEDKHEP
jgi:hypothetical protein